LISRVTRAYHHYLLIHFHFSFFLHPFRSIDRVRWCFEKTDLRWRLERRGHTRSHPEHGR
jgi:hypothetical protein